MPPPTEDLYKVQRFLAVTGGIFYGIVYRGWNPMLDFSRLAIGVPLGGWNHNVGICGSGVLAVSDTADECFLARWRLRFAGFDKYSARVRLTDHVGDRVTLPIETVIQVFEKCIGIEGLVYSRFEAARRQKRSRSQRSNKQPACGGRIHRFDALQRYS